MSKWEYTEHELWRYGENGYSIYHVFSVCAIEQTVFVFAEGRCGDGSDANCPHDIVMKKSLDGGKTFPVDVCLLTADEGHCWTNACPLYDDVNKRLFLFYSDNQKNRKTENYYITSDDLGATWSEPVCITHILADVERPLPFHLAGPGHGICLKRAPYAGRLLMQFWHRGADVTLPVGERGYCASVLFSDDGGQSWQSTPYLGKQDNCHESRLAETRTGVLWSARTRSTVSMFSQSVDGGTHWSEFAAGDITPARCCDIGLTSLSFGEDYGDMILLSRVGHETKRMDMEILYSLDGGKSFPGCFYLLPGDTMPGYSDLCIIADGEPIIGLVHCRNNHVLFSRISLQTLTGGKYDNTTRSVWLQ